MTKRDTNFQGLADFSPVQPGELHVSHYQARSVPRALSAHPLRHQAQRAREIYDAVLSKEANR